MAETKKDEPLLEKDGADDFFDKAKRNSALIFAIVFFMICSSGMLLVNKAVLLTWDLPITVTIFQMVFCSLYLVATDPFTKQLRVGSWADARRWAIWVPTLFAAMLATSMLALNYSSTGAVVVTRNIAPIVTLALEAAMKEKVSVDSWVVLSLVYTLIGVVLYMINDVTFSAIGFICIIANMVAAVLERLVQRRLIAVEPVDLSKMVLVLINNSFAIPWVALLLWPTKEYDEWHTLKPEEVEHWTAWLFLGLSCVAGVCIGWAGVNAQYYLTATSFMVLGNLNKFIVIAVGMLVMGESSSWEAVLGCFVAITGGLLYAIARNRLNDKMKVQREAAKKAKEAEEAKEVGAKVA